MSNTPIYSRGIRQMGNTGLHSFHGITGRSWKQSLSTMYLTNFIASEALFGIYACGSSAVVVTKD